MPLLQLTVTLDPEIQTYNSTGRFLHPADKNSSWFTTSTFATEYYIDPQNYIHVRSAETNALLVNHIAIAHPELAALNCTINETAAYDADGRFYFTLYNGNYQTIVIKPGDNLAIIKY